MQLTSKYLSTNFTDLTGRIVNPFIVRVTADSGTVTNNRCLSNLLIRRLL